MALGDFTYRLKAESGDSTPHDELGVSGDLSGGTITLEDDGSGGKCWRFSGIAQASAPTRAADNDVSGSGATIAFRLRVNTEGTGTEHYLSYKTADTGFYGLQAGRTGTGVLSLQYRSTSSIKNAISGYAFGSGWVTYVIRVSMVSGSSNDYVSAWYEGGGSHPTADGISGPSSGFADVTMARVEIGNAASAVLDVSDFVVWAEELSDSDCAALVDVGIRATLDGAGDTTAPILSSPTGTATGSTTATVGATTDESNGTMYAFVSTSATPPSATDLKAGTGATWSGSQAISTTGAKTFNATGLTASTGYYAHLIHTDAAANDSNIVTSAQFTTTAANSAPSWSGTPSAMSAKRGQALTPQDITSLVSDADLDTLSYSITGAPAGVTINSSTGVISGTPTAAPGVYACTVEADDGIASPVSSSSFNITVQQATLALNAAGYEIGDGSAPATMAVDASVAWEIEVINDALPPVSVYHSDSVTTSAAGRLADISDDDLIFGTTYTVLGRRVSDGEWFAFTITAT